MSQETILRDDGGNEYSMVNLATQKWLDGHYSGLDQCCSWLESKAVGLYASRQREEANKLQDLADKMMRELKPQMVKRAQDHEREFPYKLTAKSIK